MRGAIAFLISSTPVIFEDSFPLTTLSIHLANVSSDCLFSLNTVENPLSVFKNIYNVLVKNGKFLTVLPSQDNLKEFKSFFALEEVDIEASFCAPEEIQKINKQFRHKNKTTNVLSFPDKDLTKISNSCIGEILICNDVLEKESIEQNKNVFDHFVHLIIHSMLHMVGYGHEAPNDAILMENKEVKFLSQIGISDPYK